MGTTSERQQSPTSTIYKNALSRIVGQSQAIADLRQEIKRIAPYAVNVLVTGPTGTGKEVVARTIHQASPRWDKPFIPVDCAAVTGTLFASHMFGHLKGAFTGATYTSLGCFRAAEGGTIFLDEIGEMELSLQAKLLRVLQQSTVVPVGGHAEIPIDVRVVAATNRNLALEVERGNFREDLYYRLNVVELHLPPLSERKEDIGLLATHFLSELAFRHGTAGRQLEQGALAALSDYPWPGNVRQLQNVLERLMLMSHGDAITEEEAVGCLSAGTRRCLEEVVDVNEVDEIDLDLQETESPYAPAVPGDASDTAEAWFSLDDLERKYIELTLKRTFYNQSAAAKLLKMDRSALRRRIEQLGVPIPKSRRGRPRKSQ